MLLTVAHKMPLTAQVPLKSVVYKPQFSVAAKLNSGCRATDGVVTGHFTNATSATDRDNMAIRFHQEYPEIGSSRGVVRPKMCVNFCLQTSDRVVSFSSLSP